MKHYGWLLLAALWAAGCGVPVDEAAEGEPAALRIAVIPKGTTHEFWRSVEAGARKAEQESGGRIRVFWKGPLREDDRDQQIQVVEQFMAQRVAGIVLAPLDSQALVRPVATARKAGIPTVIIDSGLQSDQLVSFVATDNFKGGEMAGTYLAELMGGKGQAILLRYAVGSASTEQREAGFLNALQAWPEIRLISSDQYAGPTRETAYQASQNLLHRFGREVEGIFCVNENSTIGMTKALREIGRAAGQVKLVGFDAGSQSIKDLKNGDVQGLIVQDPLRMGYEGVKTLVRYLDGGVVDERIDTGVTLVTETNLEDPDVRPLLYPPLERYLP